MNTIRNSESAYWFQEIKKIHLPGTTSIFISVNMNRYTTFCSIERAEIHLPIFGSNISTSEKHSDPSPPPTAKSFPSKAAAAKLPFSLFREGHRVHLFFTALYDSTSNRIKLLKKKRESRERERQKQYLYHTIPDLMLLLIHKVLHLIWQLRHVLEHKTLA